MHWLHKKIEYDSVTSMHACSEKLCTKTMWCASVEVRASKQPVIDFCYLCAGTPKSLIGKNYAILSIRFMLNQVGTKMMMDQYER